MGAGINQHRLGMRPMREASGHHYFQDQKEMTKTRLTSDEKRKERHTCNASFPQTAGIAGQQ
jgi:hypothetical protein